MKKFDKERAIELEENLFALGDKDMELLEARKANKKEIKAIHKEYQKEMKYHPFIRTARWISFGFSALVWGFIGKAFWDVRQEKKAEAENELYDATFFCGLEDCNEPSEDRTAYGERCAQHMNVKEPVS